MSIQPLTFTGVSSLSDSLQEVLKRAVSIASMPLQQLHNQDADVLQRKTLLGGLSTAVSGLGSAVARLGDVASKQALAATSSNSAKVSVTNTGAAAPVTYTVSDITSLAAAASETSIAGYGDATTTAVSANGSMRLVVGANTYDFTLTNNSLAGLRDKINSLNAGVTATILTTGSNNYLSVSANNTGATTLQIVDDPAGTATQWLTSANQGSDAVFKLNGLNISRKTNTVNDIIPGVVFTVKDKTGAGESVTLTLATDRSQLSSAIADFVDAYNALLDATNAQVGSNAGLLSGDFLIREVQGDMRSLAGYQSSGAIRSLADMGVTFDNLGKVSFDETVFDALSDDQISAALSFFGSKTSGFGALADQFTQLSDPITGLIKLQQDSYDREDARLQDQIAEMETRINDMQIATAARLQAADALLAQLESQQQMLDASIKSVNLVTFGKNQDQ
jgi:flagellar hook-associated protein 2